jgi:endonuclease YncB( thermonuclease family)
MKFNICLSAALALALCSGASADEYPRQISGLPRVIDGDTIEINKESIRLNGFDSAEKGSQCGSLDVYESGKAALSDFIGTQTVECQLIGKTGSRHVGICSAGGKELGEHMVSTGWARDWPRYSKRAYADEEKTARDAKAGIWGLQCPADLWGARNYE